jgi:hypothetical protein
MNVVNNQSRFLFFKTGVECMERYYVFNPGTGKFLNREGNWTTFSGAKDFMSMVEVRRACEKLSPTIVRFVFKLVHDAQSEKFSLVRHTS